MQLSEGREQLGDFRLRLGLTLAGILLLSALISGRLWLLQTRDHSQLARRADSNRTTDLPVQGVRGLIYDRKGTVLADNVPSWQLEVVPERVEDMQATLDELAEFVNLAPHELQRFHDRRQGAREFQPVPLKLNLSPEELARLEVNRERWPGVRVQATLTRRYPRDSATAHLVGYVGGITARDLAADEAGVYRGASHIGKTGVERAYEEALRPIPGTRRLESDAQGRRLRELDYQAPIPGWDLRLTLDSDLQRATEGELEGRRAAAIALDLRNGDVLALVSMPSFDPHLFVNGISHADYQRLLDDPGNPLFNRALQGRYPPGSTIKPVFALAGLEYGLRHPRDHTYCQGWFTLPDKQRRYRDWKRSGHGRVNLRDSVAQSCDVYYYQLAHEMGIDRLAEFAGRFGIGSATGIPLPAEDVGILPSRDWKMGALGESWYPGETLNVGIGQGYMLMTPMQMALMTVRIATRGEGFEPRVVQTRSRRALVREEPVVPLPRLELRDRRHWEEIHDSMVAVVHGWGGTARAVGEGLPFRVAGKTGTAQVAGLSQEDDEAPQLDDVPYKLRDHSLFIAFAPAEAPEIAVSVIVEHSGGGSAVAAPVAKVMLENYLMRCDGVVWRPWCLEADI